MFIEDQSSPSFSAALLHDVKGLRLTIFQRMTLFEEAELLYAAKVNELRDREHQIGLEESESEWSLKEYFAMLIEHFEFELPNVNQSTTFITLHNLLIGSLNQICERLQTEILSDVGLKHFAGEGLDRALLFLQLIVRLEIYGVDEDIEFLSYCRELRELMTQDAIKMDDKTANAFFQSKKLPVSLIGSALVFTPEFVRKFSSALRRLFDEIHRSMTVWGR